MNYDNTVESKDIIEEEDTGTISHQSRIIGDFFINPKPYDDIAFEYLVQTALFCYVSHPKINYYSNVPLPMRPISMVTFNDNYYMLTFDLLKVDQPNTLVITMPGSSGYMPRLKKNHITTMFNEFRHYCTLFSLGSYRPRDKFLYLFRNANYIEGVSIFMRSTVEKMVLHFMKLFYYKPNTEHLELHGWSLSGGTCLYALKEIAQILINNPEFLKNLKTIKVSSCSPVGVNNITADQIQNSVSKLLKARPELEITIMHAIGFGDQIPLVLPIFINDEDINTSRFKQILVVVYDHNAPKVQELLGPEFSSHSYRPAHFLTYLDIPFEEVKYAQVIRGFTKINKFLTEGMCVGDRHTKDISYLRDGTIFSSSYHNLANLNGISVFNSLFQLCNVVSEIFNIERDFEDLKENLYEVFKEKLISEQDVIDVISRLKLYNHSDFVDKFKDHAAIYVRLEELRNNKEEINKNTLYYIKKPFSCCFYLLLNNSKLLYWQIKKIVLYIGKIFQKIIDVFLFLYRVVRLFIFEFLRDVIITIFAIPTLLYYHLCKKHEMKRDRENLQALGFYSYLQPQIVAMRRSKALERFHLDCEFNHNCEEWIDKHSNCLDEKNTEEDENLKLPSCLQAKKEYLKFIEDKENPKRSYFYNFCRYITKYIFYYSHYVYKY